MLLQSLLQGRLCHDSPPHPKRGAVLVAKLLGLFVWLFASTLCDAVTDTPANTPYTLEFFLPQDAFSEERLLGHICIYVAFKFTEICTPVDSDEHVHLPLILQIKHTAKPGLKSWLHFLLCHLSEVT